VDATPLPQGSALWNMLPKTSKKAAASEPAAAETAVPRIPFF